jgi:hypothetical protein
MRNKKNLLIIVFICSILYANAQEAKTDSMEVVASKRSFIIKTDSATLTKKLLDIQGVSAVEIDTKNQIVVVKYDSTNQKVLDRIYKINEKINTKLVDYVKPAEKPVAVEQIKFKPEIDKFLNIEDESIFSDDKSMNFSEEQIHPRSKDYYLLICNISRLKNLLNEISDLSIGKKQEAKNKLSAALKIINTINDETDKCYKLPLSQKQKDFYINLVNEFNKLYADIY